MQVAERPLGVFSRQLFLGDTLDTEHIDAGYEAGVLTLRIPIAEKAKPRKIAINASDRTRPSRSTPDRVRRARPPALTLCASTTGPSTTVPRSRSELPVFTMSPTATATSTPPPRPPSRSRRTTCLSARTSPPT